MQKQMAEAWYEKWAEEAEMKKVGEVSRKVCVACRDREASALVRSKSARPRAGARRCCAQEASRVSGWALS